MKEFMQKKVFESIRDAGNDYRRENKDPITKKEWVKGDHLQTPHIG